MLKTELFNLVNDSREYNDLPPISKEEYILTLSTLEASGYIASAGEDVEVIKEYPAKGGL